MSTSAIHFSYPTDALFQKFSVALCGRIFRFGIDLRSPSQHTIMPSTIGGLPDCEGCRVVFREYNQPHLISHVTRGFIAVQLSHNPGGDPKTTSLYWVTRDAATIFSTLAIAQLVRKLLPADPAIQIVPQADPFRGPVL